MELSRIRHLLLIIILNFMLPLNTSGLTLSCFEPNNYPSNYHDSEIIVDCSHHDLHKREDLIIQQSRLCSISKWCDKITVFDYSYNSIQHLAKPEYHTFEFPYLKKLIFRNNFINLIDDDAFSEMSLRFLDLRHNNISGGTLRKNTFRSRFNVSNLEGLRLGYNRIEYLNKETFAYLTKLTVLELNNNPLSVIGDSTLGELQSLARLNNLHLGSTNISNLPIKMFDHMTLITLYLNGNHLNRVPNLKGLSKTLQNLNLDGNQFEELNQLSFPSLTHLNNLNISSNDNLRSIGRNSFNDLHSLQILYCNYNHKLAKISSDAFNMEWNLRELYLNNNGLTSLSHKLGDWDNLEILEIQFNPWTCDCSIQWLIDYIVQRQHTEPDLNYYLHCSSPVQFKGVHFLSNKLLSYISGECPKRTLETPTLSSQLYKLYPLLFVMSLLLITMIAYLICATVRFTRNHMPYVCDYTVHYNKLLTEQSEV